MNKINVAVIFGGNSLESDVSIITAKQIVNALNKEKYNIYSIYIDEQNVWWYINNSFSSKDDINAEKKCRTYLKSGENYFYFKKRIKNKIKIQCAVLALHGGFGEKGYVQALLEMCGIAHTSSSVLSSGICMDKSVTKDILRANGFEVLEYIVVKKRDDYQSCVDSFVDKNGFPLIVKPVDMGSSVGVELVGNCNDLYQAIQFALKFSHAAIVEKGIKGVVEYNCSAFKRGNEIVVSNIEKPIKKGDILTYIDKYGVKGVKTGGKVGVKTKIGGMNSLGRECPAKIGLRLSKKILEKTINAYQLFDCKGVVRCDFIYHDKTLYLNEINTIPGSLAFYLWENEGYNFTGLLDEIIKQAINDCTVNKFN